MKKTRVLLVFLAFSAISGCQTYNLNDSVGVANIGMAGLAQATLLACGNTAPGGACSINSLITRSDADRIKQELTTAAALLDAATASGKPANAMESLASAQRILLAIEKILVDRGVAIQ